jgi:hypothetical protein
VPDFLAMILAEKPEAGRKMHLPSGLYIFGGYLWFDAFAKTYRMAKQKFRSTRPGVFSGAFQAYIEHVEILKKRRNTVGRTFCDAIKISTAESQKIHRV